MTIKINKIIPQTVVAYNPEGESLGEVNFFEYNDLRIQIKKAKVSGYYVIFNQEKIMIRPNGQQSKCPDGFFDLWDKQLDVLLED